MTTADVCFKVIDIIVGAGLGTIGVLYFILLFSFRNVILGVFAIVFGLTIILTEAGLQSFINKECGFLNHMMGRGVFYLFCGLLMMDNSPPWLFISTIAIAAIGGLYLILACIPAARPSKYNRR
ncbi:hypothetical protein MP638_003927 [Amoeboaphelidium occidentale]|nr:hypothetical protein MP638_003927 [Amoeboaphelidium occidentale]